MLRVTVEATPVQEPDTSRHGGAAHGPRPPRPFPFDPGGGDEGGGSAAGVQLQGIVGWSGGAGKDEALIPALGLGSMGLPERTDSATEQVPFPIPAELASARRNVQ